MTIDERIEALTMSLELLTQDVQDLTRDMKSSAVDIKDSALDIKDLKILAQQDGENIRALARIAEIHERRLTDLEDNQ